jgi:hypothetical protein
VSAEFVAASWQTQRALRRLIPTALRHLACGEAFAAAEAAIKTFVVLRTESFESLDDHR